LLSGDMEKAKAMARSFIRRFPKEQRSASIRAILGEIAWREASPRTAANLLTKALEGKLDNEIRARSLYVLSEANAEVFHYASSVEALRKAIALFPKVPG
jgi:ribosomal protein S3AE